MKSLFFNIKLLFIFLFFIVYIGLEVNLNIVLVELYSHSLSDVFGHYKGLANDIELFGRVITGFGLALTLVTFIPKPWFELQPQSTAKEYVLKPVTLWLVRPLILVLIWVLLIPSLRMVVDTVVYQSSNGDKLSAIRAVVFKEALNLDMIEFEGSKELSDIAKNAEQRRLLVALIPSLAYFSPTVKLFIQDKTEDLVVNFMEKEQELAFVTSARPLLKKLKQVHQSEWALYQKSKKEAEKASTTVNTFAKLKRVTEQKQASVVDDIHGHWLFFQKQMTDAEKYVEPLADLYFEDFKKQRDKYLSSKCNASCRSQVNKQWTQTILGTGFEGSDEKVKLAFADDMKWFARFMIGGKKNIFRLKLREGREKYFMDAYGVNKDVEYNDFIHNPQLLRIAINNLKSENIIVANDWVVEDVLSLKQAIETKYKNLESTVWSQYKKQSVYKINNRNLDKISFAKQSIVTRYQKNALGRFYYPSFKVFHSEQQVYDAWQKGLDNLSFIKMLTGAAAETAFAPGGTFYKLGIEAVKFSVIPPISIVLSFLAIFALMVKFTYYLWQKEAKIHAALFGSLVLFVVLGSVTNTIIKPHSYTQMMTSFADNTDEIKQGEKIFTSLFGAVMDVESLIYGNRATLTGFSSIEGFTYAVEEETETGINTTYVGYSENSPVRLYDDWFNHTFEFIPEVIGVGKLTKPYDFNLTVYKRDQKVGMYMGLHQDNGIITKVTIPNILANNDIGFLLNQKMFYKPNYQNLLLDFVQNVEDPEYWFTFATGEFGKQTFLNVIENNTLELLSDKKSNYANLIKQSVQKGYKNLLLVQQSKGRKYDCYELPELDIANLVNSLTGEQLPNANKFECKGEFL